ncbi:histidine kinase [Isoptericola sp. b441]|uniref:Histidine kinase n=1 Tax=Actinotalea lenta TaxID=3064654 RepID=A0ABT9DAT4_9CELL|nr:MULTISPECIES: ATP-binding protein [unclassified Isoptericola]MDO8108017.1 histidine kinase [Isoptericola sp. b441]MDO8120313.1 histidine kinase [Isoptericola sp. b490]
MTDPADPAARRTPAPGRTDVPYRSAFERAPIGIAVVTVDRAGADRVVHANAALSELLGLPGTELRGTQLSRSLADLAPAPGAPRPLGPPTDRPLPPGPVVTRLISGSGAAQWVQLRTVVLEDAPSPLMLVYLDLATEHRELVLQARRDAVLRLLAAVTTEALEGRPVADILQHFVEQVARAFHSQDVILGFPDEDGLYHPRAATGPVGRAVLTGQVPIDQEAARRLASMTAGGLASPGGERHSDEGLTGPRATTVLPLRGLGTGLLTAARLPGEPDYDEDEVSLLSTAGRQVALTIELAAARTDRDQLAVLRDRERIARDLHDTVVQDLLALGMQLSRLLADTGLGSDTADVLGSLDRAVQQLRTLVPVSAPAAAANLRDALLDVVASAATSLGHPPDVSVRGSFDLVPPSLDHHVLAVLREALSNVARHAHATRTRVSVTVDAERIRLTVEDDGCGLRPSTGYGQGLANIRARAVEVGGHVRWSRGPLGGTLVTWSCPLNRT